MARIKGKYKAVIELDLDAKVTDSMLSFPATCKVTQEIAEIELIEE